MNLPPLVYIAGVCVAYLLLRPLCTVIHESGHLLYLLLSGHQGEIRVFIGSLGDGKRSWRVRVGRVQWLFHPIGFLLRGSICDFDEPLRNRQILPYALAGPLASLLLAGLGILIVLSPGPLDAPEWLRALAALPTVLALFDTALSFLHRRDPQQLANESITANDGQLIGWKLRFGRWTADFLHACWLFEHERYAEANAVFRKMHDGGCNRKDLLEYLISCELAMGNAGAALDWHGKMLALEAADADDHWRAAVALVAQDRLPEGLAEIERALEMAPGHAESLNLRAFLALQRGEHVAALGDLNLALRTPLEIGHIYANRAWAHLLAGNGEAARKDLLLAMKYEAENPNLHVHWARYWEGLGDVERAEEARMAARVLGGGF